jgi:hypothetical protein
LQLGIEQKPSDFKWLSQFHDRKVCVINHNCASTWKFLSRPGACFQPEVEINLSLIIKIMAAGEWGRGQKQTKCPEWGWARFGSCFWLRVQFFP